MTKVATRTFTTAESSTMADDYHVLGMSAETKDTPPTVEKQHVALEQLEARMFLPLAVAHTPPS